MSSFKISDRYALLIIVVATAVVLSLFSTLTSPFYPQEFLSGAGWDNAIFTMMGRMHLQGGIPYCELFDHKVPVLWLIQALGQTIHHGTWGIFLLLVISWQYRPWS